MKKSTAQKNGLFELYSKNRQKLSIVHSNQNSYILLSYQQLQFGQTLFFNQIVYFSVKSTNVKFHILVNFFCLNATLVLAMNFFDQYFFAKLDLCAT